MITVPLVNDTIPHEIKTKYCGSVVLLKPAPDGTGIKAGASLRAVAEVLGVKNIVTKIWRSRNPSNVVKAAHKGLESMIDVKEEMSQRINKNVSKEVKTDE